MVFLFLFFTCKSTNRSLFPHFFSLSLLLFSREISKIKNTNHEASLVMECLYIFNGDAGDRNTRIKYFIVVSRHQTIIMNVIILKTLIYI